MKKEFLILFILFIAGSGVHPIYALPESPVDGDSLISAKNKEATILYNQGLYYESEEILKQVLELKKLYNPNNIRSIANTYSNLGVLNKKTFRTQNALNYYDKAEYIYKSLGDSPGRLASVYYNKSSLFYTTSDYYKCERYLNETTSILDTIEMPSYLSLPAIYSLYGYVEIKKGNEDKALEFFKIAENCSKSIDDKLIIYEIIVHGFLFSNKYYQYKQYINEYLSKIERALQEVHNYQTLIRYHLNRGSFNYKIENKKKPALEQYKKAIEIIRDVYGDKHPIYNLAFIYFIRYFYKENNYILTLDYVQKAFENLSVEFQDDGSYENPDPDSFNDYDPVFFHLRYKILSFLHLYKEDLNLNYLYEAKENADYTLSLIEKLKWKYDHENHKYYISETETEIFKIAEKIYYDLFKRTGEEKYRDRAFELNERAKAFSLLINLRSEQAMEFGGIPPELIKQEADIIQKISAFTEFVLEEENIDNPDENKIKNWENALFQLNNEHDQLIEFFEKNYPEYYRLKYDTRVISSAELQKNLSNSEVLLEFSLSDSILFTYLISNEETLLFEQDVDTSFRRLCLDFYNVITEQSFSYGVNETFRNYTQKGYQLYQTLIKPVENLIEGKNIIVIPDGEISYVSFEALLTENVQDREFSYYNLPYLVLDHGFSNSFSATVHYTESPNKRKTSRNILAFAPSYSNINAQNLAYGLLRQDDREKLIRIPGVKEEVRKISSFMDADVYMDMEATESNFKKNAPQYKVLHLAMHTILDDEDPLYSKLAFTQMVDSIDDGFLHTYEIYNMQINADLAVLSSCNSGFGELQEGEGIQSLARGFAYAGCPSILMTLWEVADNSTVDIMEKFYYYLNQGLSKSEALRRSKIDFLANADQLKSNPFFWSSFVLVGNSEPIYTNGNLSRMMNLGILLIPLPLLLIFYRRYKSGEKEKDERNHS